MDNEPQPTQPPAQPQKGGTVPDPVGYDLGRPEQPDVTTGKGNDSATPDAGAMNA